MAEYEPTACTGHAQVMHRYYTKTTHTHHAHTPHTHTTHTRASSTHQELLGRRAIAAEDLTTVAAVVLAVEKVKLPVAGEAELR